MRRAKFFAAAGLMAMSIFSGLAFNVNEVKADEAATVGVSLSDVEGEAGDTVTVDVVVTSNPGTILAQTTFAYDSDLVTVTNVESKNLFNSIPETDGEQSDYVKPNLEKNPLQLIDGYGAVAADSTATGTLFTITLKINEDAEEGATGEISFAGKFLDWNLNDYDVVSEPATVKVIVKETEDDTTDDSNKPDDTKETEDTSKSDDTKTTDDTSKSDDTKTTDNTSKSDDTKTTDNTSKSDDTKTTGNSASTTTNATVKVAETQTTTTAKTSPRTGDTAPVAVLLFALAAAVTTVVVGKKKVNE